MVWTARRHESEEFRQDLYAWYGLMTFAIAQLLTDSQIADLEAWEHEHVTGGEGKTSDWPGWEPLIGPRPRFGHPHTTKAKIPEDLRWEVLERDDFTCRACGTGDDLAADHVIPESLGGPTTLANLQTLCRSCNSAKGTSTELPGTGVPAN